METEIGRLVVDDERRAGREVKPLGQREDEAGIDRDPVGPAAVPGESDDAVADPRAVSARRRLHDAGDFGPGDEWQLWALVVPTVGAEELREGDAGRAHLDQTAPDVRRGLQLHEFEPGRSAQAMQLLRSHFPGRHARRRALSARRP